MNIYTLNRACLRVIVLTALSLQAAGASGLVYTPVNPSFGGNPNNGPNLMGIATAQNNTQAPSTKLSPIQRFQNSLQQSILNAVLTGIKSALVKADGTLNDGTYAAGIYQITVETNTDTGMVTITTTDTTNNAKVSFTVSDASLATVTTPNQ